MTFASISSIQSDMAGAGMIEQAARRLWMQGKGEWYAEAASLLREARDATPWAVRVVDIPTKLWQR